MVCAPLAFFDALAGQRGFSPAFTAGFVAFVGTIAGLCYGGWAFLVYVGLRIDLWRTGLLPLRLARLLDQAKSCGLMTADGSGYRFRHQVIQRRLADAFPVPVRLPAESPDHRSSGPLPAPGTQVRQVARPAASPFHRYRGTAT